ncbi:MAG TPA: hypothetical protein VMA83_10390 [Solirubrobacteraceae bacterium]|nr:hypothetical protein [Solirubrobacteraceae bacterium]
MLGRTALRFAPVLAVAAVAFSPAVAHATEPHWYLNNVRLPEGKHKAFKTSGTFTFTNTNTGVSVTCNVADAEVVENPIGGGAGIDAMKSFKVSNCTPDPCPAGKTGTLEPLVIKALNLPWPTKLVEVPPIADEISGMELKFSCKGSTVSQTYSGTLRPWVLLGALEFDSPTTGMLGVLAVNGIDNFAPPGLTAKNP